MVRRRAAILEAVLRKSVGGIPLAPYADKIVLTDLAVSAPGVELLSRRLTGASRPRVIVLGGSHSAFSSAWTILRHCPEVRLREGAIRILHRDRLRVYYPTTEDADRDDYRDYDEDDICPRTQRVHRFGGLRGDGRELWRRITARPGVEVEPRVQIVPVGDRDDASPDRIRGWLDEATVVIPAFGYTAATIPVHAPDGGRLALAGDFGSDLVGGDGRVRLHDGGTVPNLFATGMASGFRPRGALGGERSFQGQTNGVWLYHNGVGEIVLRGLEETLEQGGRPVR